MEGSRDTSVDLQQPSPGGLIFGLTVYVHLRSSGFRSMQRCRSRTLTVFGELLSRVLKIGRLMVRL
jgi:hypothetical protein